MNKIVFFIFCIFLIGVTFAQTKPKPNPKIETYRYNGKKVSKQQLLELLNKDLEEFCKKEKKLKKS